MSLSPYPLLALDTSGSQASVALATPQGVHCAVSYARNGHAQILLQMVDDLLISAEIPRQQLANVAVVHGPGSFTGLRIAVSVAQGIALGCNCEVIAVDSLTATAQHALGLFDSSRDCLVFVALDARLNEVYSAAFQWHAADAQSAGQLLQLATAQLGSAQQALERFIDCIGVNNAGLPRVAAGTAWTAFPVLSALACQPGWQEVSGAFARADAVADCATVPSLAKRLTDVANLSPLYLRNKVALDSGEQQALRWQRQFAPLREMSAAELAVLMAIERDIYTHPWTEGNFADALASGYDLQVLTLASDPTRIVAYFVVMEVVDEAHLLNISVAREWQRKGIGQWLLDQVIRGQKQRGLQAVLLEVRPSNEAARALYQKRGFVRIGVRRKYYPAQGDQREDALVMRLSLQ